MFESIDNWTRQANPLVVGLAGSALFAVAIWIGGKIKNQFLNQFRAYRRWKESEEIKRTIIFNYYISRDEIQFFTKGYFLLIYTGLRYLFALVIFSLFGFTLFLLDVGTPIVIGYLYFLLIMFFDGLLWFSQTKKGKSLDAYDSQLVDEIKKELAVAEISQRPKKLRIVNATYGTDQKYVDVTEQLRRKVINDQLITRVTNEIGGDPHPGIVKQLIIEYEFDSVASKLTFQEGDEISLPR